MIGDRIKTTVEDNVWQLCLKLREVVDLICAPKIHTNQVAYLKVLIEEFLKLRVLYSQESCCNQKTITLSTTQSSSSISVLLFDYGHCALKASTAILSSVQGNFTTLKASVEL